MKYGLCEFYIRSMLMTIAEDNKKHQCDCCLSTANDLLVLAELLLGADTAEELELEYNERLKEEKEQ